MLKKIKPLMNILSRLVLGKRLHEILRFRRKMKYWPNLKNPQSFCEKTLHMKLYRNMDYAIKIGDKFLVRDYIKNKIGEEYLNDIFLVAEKTSDIDFEKLPQTFVMKGAHGSGKDFIFLVKDKSKISKQIIKDKASYMLSHKIGFATDENWYLKMKPRVLFERFLYEDDFRVPSDYKIFTFGGKAYYIQVDFGRFTKNHYRVVYDCDWNKQNLEVFHGYPCKGEIKKPKKMEKMIELAEILGKDFDAMRVDFYCINEEKIVFGELTPCSGAGTMPVFPISFDFEMGNLWDYKTNGK
ncbi:MAG: ATP-grasp fold amidoligase family protein [Alphaproteobacteria bacterium]